MSLTVHEMNKSDYLNLFLQSCCLEQYWKVLHQVRLFEEELLLHGLVLALQTHNLRASLFLRECAVILNNLILQLE